MGGLPDLYSRLLRGGLWALAGRVGVAAGGLLVAALVTRLAPPGDVGRYFQMVAVIGMATCIFQFGLPQAVLRDLAARHPAAPAEAARLGLAAAWLAVLLGGGGALFLAAFLWLLAGHFGIPGPGIAAAAGGWLLATVVSGVLAECFRAVGRLRAAALLSGLLTVSLTLGVLLVATGLGVTLDFAGIVLLFFAAATTACLVALLGFGQTFGRMATARPTLGDCRALFLGGGAVGISNILLTLFSQADVVMLGMLRGSEEVASYGAAARVVALVGLMLGVINLALSPLIAELGAQRRMSELEVMLRRVATLAGLPAIVLLGIFAWQGGWLLELLFGPAYRAGAPILVILALGQVVNVLTGSCGTVLVMTGNGATMLRITLVCGLATLAAALLLGGRFGGAGMAVAVAGGLVLQNLAMLAWVRRLTGIWTHCYLRWPPRAS